MQGTKVSFGATFGASQPGGGGSQANCLHVLAARLQNCRIVRKRHKYCKESTDKTSRSFAALLGLKFFTCTALDFKFSGTLSFSIWNKAFAAEEHAAYFCACILLILLTLGWSLCSPTSSTSARCVFLQKENLHCLLQPMHLSQAAMYAAAFALELEDLRWYKPGCVKQKTS